jgi:hypothetical protein
MGADAQRIPMDLIHSIHVHKVEAVWSAVIHLKDGQRLKLDHDKLPELCNKLAAVLET